LVCRLEGSGCKVKTGANIHGYQIHKETGQERAQKRAPQCQEAMLHLLQSVRRMKYKKAIKEQCTPSGHKAESTPIDIEGRILVRLFIIQRHPCNDLCWMMSSCVPHYDRNRYARGMWMDRTGRRAAFVEVVRHARWKGRRSSLDNPN